MDWYYADDDHQQIGPINDEQLFAAYESGVITEATLVWRDGMDEWLPLGTVVELPQKATGPAKCGRAGYGHAS